MQGDLEKRLGYARRLGMGVLDLGTPVEPPAKPRRGRPRMEYDARGRALRTMDGWFSWMLPVRR
jgi:hypothetical protein